MSNYTSINRLCSELNRTLGITSDIERENLIRSYYNQGLISYRQYYLLLVSVRRHEYIKCYNNHGPNHEYYLYTVNKHDFKDFIKIKE